MSKKYILLILLLSVLTQTGCASYREPGFSVSDAASFYREEHSDFADDLERVTAGHEPFQYKDFSSDYGSLKDYRVLENGGTYFLYEKKGESEAASKSYEYHILKFSQENSSYDIINVKLPGHYLDGILVSPDEHLILAGSDTLYLYAPQPPGEREPEAEPYAQIKADFRMGCLFPPDGGIVCMPVLGESYYSYDLDTGKRKGVYLDKKYLYNNSINHFPYLQQSAGSILLVTGAGIYEKAENGWTLQVSSERNSMCRSDFNPLGVWKGGQGDYFVKTYNLLYRYFKSDQTQESKSILKLQSGVEFPLLRDITVSYQINHPEITVEYTYLEAKLPDSQQEINSMLQRMNADIVSGSAADIYILDSLPWKYYQEKGCLLPLDSLAEEITYKENCFENIINACYYRDGIYFIPAYYSANLFVYRKELEGVAEDILALAEYLEAHPDEQALSPYTCAGNAEYCVDLMYRSYGQQLYQEGRVTRDSIHDFLYSMKIIYDRTNRTESGEASIYTAGYNQYGNYIPDELWRMDAHGEGSLITGPFTQSSYFTLFQGIHIKDCRVSLNDYFLPSLMFGLHSQTGQRETAEDFIRFAFRYLHENPSRSPLLPVFRDGLLPRIKSSLDAIREKYHTSDTFYSTTRGTQNEECINYLPTEADYAASYEPLLNNLNKIGREPGLTDSVYTIFAPSAVDLLNGKYSVDQAADEIYSRISLMINEAS